MFKQRAESKPKADDGVIQVVEPIKPKVWEEHPEMEKSVNVWVSWLSLSTADVRRLAVQTPSSYSYSVWELYGE